MQKVSGNIAHMVFRRATRGDIGEISLDGLMLKVLMEMDGTRTVLEIARKLKLNRSELLSTFSKLIKLDLIEPSDAPMELIDEAFLAAMRDQLSRIIGPLADIVIEDAILALGHRPERFPAHRAADLVTLAAQEIRAEEKRVGFEKTMLDRIRKVGT